MRVRSHHRRLLGTALLFLLALAAVAGLFYIGQRVTRPPPPPVVTVTVTATTTV